ncbi:MAG: helix-hairpin-helix domain-containing protein, partial [Gammaproteobacteria bacterium]|nr:helix-hairpin-helix domain-containing protein [Gammaproteobacteria bacterium]
AIGLAEVPGRIEAFDVSHTMGEATVASCVVFEASGPVNAEYRRFNISGVSAGDDYAALGQALQRRYRKVKEGDGVHPDLIMIDGGKGQLSAAIEVFNELQLDGVTLLAVAKGAARKPGLERLFMSGRAQGIVLKPDSKALHLIQHIRDEAHRFAIAGHRGRRSKKRLESPLQEIPGIGTKRRQSLLTHLGGLQEVARAGVEDLTAVPGINADLAQKIYAHFHAG